MEELRRIISEEVQKVFENDTPEVKKLKKEIKTLQAMLRSSYMTYDRIENGYNESKKLLFTLYEEVTQGLYTRDKKELLDSIYEKLYNWRMGVK